MLTAVITSHSNGYEYDQKEVKTLGQIGDTFEITNIEVESWCSNIFLKDHKYGFNSVNFKVINATGEDYDFLADPNFNHYLVLSRD